MGGNRRKSHNLNFSGRSKKRGNRYSKTMSEVSGLDSESDVENNQLHIQFMGHSIHQMMEMVLGLLTLIL